jgi:hypothetical protein
MGISWNEINSRELLFSKTWADASNEDSEAKPIWLAFFENFGITSLLPLVTAKKTRKSKAATD